MKKAELNEQLGDPTHGFIFANIAHVRRFVPETKHKAPNDHFLPDSFGLVSGGVRIVESIIR